MNEGLNGVGRGMRGPAFMLRMWEKSTGRDNLFCQVELFHSFFFLLPTWVGQGREAKSFSNRVCRELPKNVYQQQIFYFSISTGSSWDFFAVLCYPDFSSTSSQFGGWGASTHSLEQSPSSLGSEVQRGKGFGP